MIIITARDRDTGARVWYLAMYSMTAAVIEAREIEIVHPEWIVTIKDE